MGAIAMILILGILMATGIAVSGHIAADMESSTNDNTIVILTSVLTLMLAVGAGEYKSLST